MDVGHRRRPGADADFVGALFLDRDVEVDLAGDDAGVVDDDVEARVGDRHARQRRAGFVRVVLGLGRLRQVIGDVDQRAVANHGADARPDDLDLASVELAGEERERARSDGDVLDLEERGAAVGRVDADVVERDEERPRLNADRVARGDAELTREELARLARRPGPNELGPDEDADAERHHADRREQRAEEARDELPPVAPDAARSLRPTARRRRFGGHDPEA